jgi:hypothetical protein
MKESLEPLSLERRVEQQLRKLHLSFLPQPAAMGLHPDFLVTLPNGRLIVIEAKGAVELSAAIRQMDLFVRVFDAAGGVIAVPDTIHPGDQPSASIRVVAISDLPATLSSLAGR